MTLEKRPATMTLNPSHPLLEMREIRKQFPGVIALDGVDLDLRPGEVHVLSKEPSSAFGLLDLTAMQTQTGELLRGLGISLDLDAPVGTLGIAERQMVEVAKARQC